jgi:hypothetical protein
VKKLPGLILTAALIAVGVACSGGGGETDTASLIHRLLQASTSDQGGGLETFVGKLPDSLPVKPPQYPGSKLIVSSRQPAVTATTPTPDVSGNLSQPLLYLIVLDTAASRAKVFNYYEDALEHDPWQIASTFSTENLDTLQFSDVSDADITGVVTIARGGKDNRTSVLISLQDAGAFRRQLPAFEQQKSLPLPKQFPSDIPLYKNATVTGSAFVREPGDESFLLVLLTKDGKDQVVDFYRTEFQKLGWIVQAGAPLGVEARSDFQDSAGDIQGAIIADAFARDPRYTEVNIQFRQKPNREPAATTTPAPTGTPTANPTAAPTTKP